MLLLIQLEKLLAVTKVMAAVGCDTALKYKTDIFTDNMAVKTSVFVHCFS